MVCVRWLLASAVVALTGAGAPAGAQVPLPLAEALRLARTVAPELAAAEARMAAADLGRSQAGALPNPSVEFRVENWARGARGGGVLPDTFAVVAQTIELGGKSGARRGVADATLAAARVAAEHARRAIDAEVAGLYLEAYRADQIGRALSTQANDLAELVRVLERRVAVGTTAEADLLKLRTEQARLELDRSRANAAAAQARVRLSARIDRDVAAGHLVLPVVGVPIDVDPERALARHADVLAARQAVAAAAQRLRLANAGGIPDAHVQAGLKRTAGLNTGVIAFGLSLPVFSRNRQERAMAAGEVTALERERAAVERRVAGNLAAAHTLAVTLAERAQGVRARLVAPALDARAAARAAFAAGAGSILQLLDAERVAAEAERLAVDLESDAVSAAIDARIANGEDLYP